MASKKSHQLNNAFDDAEEEFGEDRSTEFLSQIAADRMGVTAADVIEAIIEVGHECAGEIPWRYSADKI